ARLYLRNVYWGRARALDRLGRHADSVADWGQAITLNDEKPRDGEFCLGQASSLARTGQHMEATAAVEALLRLGNADSDSLYDAACVYALAGAQAVKGAAPHTSSLRAEQYGQRAVALLRQAVKQGYKDIEH